VGFGADEDEDGGRGDLFAASGLRVLQGEDLQAALAAAVDDAGVAPDVDWTPPRSG
jgi:hypothetical protein